MDFWSRATGQYCKLSPRGQAELVERVVNVVFHRCFGDVERARNLPVSLTARDKGCNLALPARQCGERIALAQRLPQHEDGNANAPCAFEVELEPPFNRPTELDEFHHRNARCSVNEALHGASYRGSGFVGQW